MPSKQINKITVAEMNKDKIPNEFIEKNIPIPPPLPPGRKNSNPLHAMELGDSVYLTKDRYNTYSAVIYRIKNKTTKEFILRKIADGYRVWRIK